MRFQCAKYMKMFMYVQSSRGGGTKSIIFSPLCQSIIYYLPSAYFYRPDIMARSEKGWRKNGFKDTEEVIMYFMDHSFRFMWLAEEKSTNSLACDCEWFWCRLKHNGRFDRHEIAFDMRSQKLCVNDFHGRCERKEDEEKMEMWMSWSDMMTLSWENEKRNWK